MKNTFRLLVIFLIFCVNVKAYAQNAPEKSTFKSIDGQNLTFKEIINNSPVKPIVIYVWQNDLHCIEVLDSIQSNMDILNTSKVRFIALNVDKIDNDKSWRRFKTDTDFIKFVEEKKWEFPVYYDPNQVYYTSLLNGEPRFPATITIQDGKLVTFHDGWLAPRYSAQIVLLDFIKSFEDSISKTLTYPKINGVEQLIISYNIKDGKKIGTWKRYWCDYKTKSSTNKLWYIRRYNNLGLAEGEWKEYFPNNTLKEVLSYNNGNPHGKLYLYYKNGRIKLEGQYNNGTKIGEWIHYSESGEIIKKEEH